MPGCGSLSPGAVESTQDVSWIQIHAFEMHPVWFGSDSKKVYGTVLQIQDSEESRNSEIVPSN